MPCRELDIFKILGIFWEFFRNVLGTFWEFLNFFGNFWGIFWEFLWNSLGILCGILWKAIWKWKDLICLSRFCLNGEGQEFRSLELQEASSIALKKTLHYHSIIDSNYFFSQLILKGRAELGKFLCWLVFWTNWWQ